MLTKKYIIYSLLAFTATNVIFYPKFENSVLSNFCCGLEKCIYLKKWVWKMEICTLRL